MSTARVSIAGNCGGDIFIFSLCYGVNLSATEAAEAAAAAAAALPLVAVTSAALIK